MAEPNDLPLSLSPEYCKNWTKERAVSELVANAIDEQRPFSFKWKNGVLVIEDEANGLPRSSLVLGLSGKNDKQIGQFGEGLDIACLVLARTNTPMRVETVGYSFEPLIKHDANLGAEVLHIRFMEGDVKRLKGTKISITCPEALAEKVKERFRHLSVAGYKGPPNPGDVIKEGKGGRVFIGGVLVQENTSLLLSYDLATQAAKKLQNRDRSVIDAQERRGLINEICQKIDDQELLEKLVVGAQAGKGESEEMSFASTSTITPKQRKALLAIRKKLFGDVRIAILEPYNQEANLILKDYQYKLVGGEKDHKLTWILQRIYQAMDIPMASQAAKTMTTVRKDGKKKTKKEIEKETTWTKERDITPEERANLEWAVALARGLFGVHAVGEVKVYDSRRADADGEELNHGGFYDPKGQGLIALKHSLLDSRRATFGTLGHEIGHRRRHRTYYSDYHDRTRGFESELTDMIGALGEVVSKAGVDPATLRPTPGSDVLYPGARAPKGVVTPATLAADLFKQAMGAAGYTNQRQLAEAIYVRPSQLARLLRAEASPPSYPDMEAACEAVGLEPAVIGLAKVVDHFHYYRKQAYERKKNVFPSGTNRRKIEEMLTKLAESPVHVENAAEVRALMTGPFKLIDKEDLTKPFMAMLEIEKERLTKTRESIGVTND